MDFTRRHTGNGGSGHHIVPKSREVLLAEEIARNAREAAFPLTETTAWWLGAKNGVISAFNTAQQGIAQFRAGVRATFGQPAPAGQ